MAGEPQLLPRTARWLAAAVAAFLLAGCAQLVPQTVALRTGWPSGVPQQVELADVPFFPQDAYQCGPAALATVLAHAGVAVTPDALVDQVWLPARHGSLQLEMLATPRRYGRVSYRIAPRYGDLLREVAAGHPVVVLQDLGFLWPRWHYAVVNGYDYATGTVYLRSDMRARVAMSFTAFERAWLKGHYWAMVVLPPSRIAATATEESWLRALSALARGGDADTTIAAYRTALARWPDSLPAAVGLANHLHARGSLAEALEVLQDARKRHPQSVIVLNNLAQTLSDLGRHREALEVIEHAADPQSPFAGEVRATRQLIEQRLRARPSPPA